MTCIAAVTNGKTVLIGADSCSTAGWSTQIRKDQKIFRCFDDRAVIGFTSSWRMGQLIKFNISQEIKLSQSDLDDAEKFLICTFIPRLREMSRTHGAMTVENSAEHLGQFIIGMCGKIYVIERDFSVSQLECDYAAIGAGQQVAEGALYATQHTKTSMRKRIMTALEAAAEHCVGVKSPFYTLSVTHKRS